MNILNLFILRTFSSQLIKSNQDIHCLSNSFLIYSFTVYL